MEIKTDVVIVGTGVGGAFSALNLPEDKQILMITKSDLESSDSFLAQGGICVLRDDEDYEGYFEDTMRAGHYENRKESVDIMIRSSQEIIHDLLNMVWILLKKTEILHLQEKVRIPDQGFFSMKILQGKRLRVNCS